MASNPNENRPPQNNTRKPNRPNFFRRNGANRNTGPQQRPVSLLIPQTSSSPLPNPLLPSSNLQPNQPPNSDSDSGFSTTSSSGSSSSPSPGQPPVRPASFRINKKCGPYSGWQLYFPEIGNMIFCMRTTPHSKE